MITNAQYHADHSTWGSSMLRVYIENPPLADALYFSHTEPIPEPSLAAGMGSMTHCELLEPDSFYREYLVAELPSRRGGKWKLFADQAAEEGKTPVLLSQRDAACAMAKTLRQDPFVKKLTRAVANVPTAKIEEPLFVQDPATGLHLKAKPDWFVPVENWFFLVDLKTSASLAEFRWSFRKYRYDLQLAFYLKVLTLAGKRDPKDNVSARFVVIVNQSPYRLVKPFVLLGDRLTKASREVDEALVRLAESLATGVWELPDAHEPEPIG